MIKTFAALGIILTLSLFFAPRAVAEDALEANAAVIARADANSDTSKLLWSSIGCGSGAVGMYQMLTEQNTFYNALGSSLQKQYYEVLNKTYGYLNPEEMQIVKNQSLEVRKRKVY